MVNRKLDAATCLSIGLSIRGDTYTEDMTSLFILLPPRGAATLWPTVYRV